MTSCSLALAIFFLVSNPAGADPVGADTTGAPDVWGERYEPKLLLDVSGTDPKTKDAVALPAAFAFHREDVEKIHVLNKNYEELKRQHEERKTENEPSLWDCTPIKIATYVVAFGAGVGFTVVILEAASD